MLSSRSVLALATLLGGLMAWTQFAQAQESVPQTSNRNAAPSPRGDEIAPSRGSRSATPRRLTASEKRRIKKAKLINDRKLRDRELKRQRRRDKNPIDERPSEAVSAGPVVNVSAEVAAKVYLFESDKSFTPDFVTDKASIGVSATKGPWGGSFGVSLAEKGDDIGIDAANVSWKPPTGTTVTMGRIPLTGASGYVADLNHWPSGLGSTDGLTIAQALEGRDAKFFSLELGGGLGNSFSDDNTFGFASRAASSLRAYFGWSKVALGPLRLTGIYGQQNGQITVKDDEATPELIEERLSDANLIEGSLGLEFEHISLGGFWSQKNHGAERYSLGDQDGLPSAGGTEGSTIPLAKAKVSQTAGGGLTLSTPVTWSTADDEKIFVTAGYSHKMEQSDESKPANEQAIGSTLGYKTKRLTLSLSYVHLQGEDNQYTDTISGESAASADRLCLGVSYKLSE